MCQFLTNKNGKTFQEYENYYTEKHYTCLRREIDIIISNQLGRGFEIKMLFKN